MTTLPSARSEIACPVCQTRIQAGEEWSQCPNCRWLVRVSRATAASARVYYSQFNGTSLKTPFSQILPATSSQPERAYNVPCPNCRAVYQVANDWRQCPSCGWFAQVYRAGAQPMLRSAVLRDSGLTQVQSAPLPAQAQPVAAAGGMTLARLLDQAETLQRALSGRLARLQRARTANLSAETDDLERQAQAVRRIISLIQDFNQGGDILTAAPRVASRRDASGVNPTGQERRPTVVLPRGGQETRRPYAPIIQFAGESPLLRILGWAAILVGSLVFFAWVAGIIP